MRTALRAFSAGGLGFAVSFLVACGGDSRLLTGAESSSLSAQLAAVSSAVNARQCIPAQTAISNFSKLVADLPPSVNPTLRRNLHRGAITVGQLAAHDCQLPATTTTPSQPKATTSSKSTRTTSSTNPTTTSATTTTTSTTTPTSTTTTPATSTTPPATRTTPPGTTSTRGSRGAGSAGAGLGGGGGGNRQ